MWSLEQTPTCGEEGVCMYLCICVCACVCVCDKKLLYFTMRNSAGHPLQYLQEFTAHSVKTTLLQWWCTTSVPHIYLIHTQHHHSIKIYIYIHTHTCSHNCQLPSTTRTTHTFDFLSHFCIYLHILPNICISDCLAIWCFSSRYWKWIILSRLSLRRNQPAFLTVIYLFYVIYFILPSSSI